MSRKRSTGTARAPSQRQLRVGELVRHALAELFTRDEIRDPDLAGITLTVSEVTVSPDLSRATAYVMPLGGAGTDAALAALDRTRRFVRGRIARMVDLRHVPDISFRLDTSFDYSDEVRKLLASPRVRRDVEDGDEG